MKKFSILAAAIALFSCHSKPAKQYQKSDTIQVAAKGPQFTFIDSAIRVIGRIRAFKDTAGLEGQLVEYTAYRMGQPTDTVRDASGHPKLDSLKHPIVHFSYPSTFTDTSMNRYIIPLVFPK